MDPNIEQGEPTNDGQYGRKAGVLNFLKKMDCVTSWKFGFRAIMQTLYPAVADNVYTDEQYLPIVEVLAGCLEYQPYGLDYVASLVNTVYIPTFRLQKVHSMVIVFVYKHIFGISGFEVVVSVHPTSGESFERKIFLDVETDGFYLSHILRTIVPSFEGPFRMQFENGQKIAPGAPALISTAVYPLKTIFMLAVESNIAVGTEVVLKNMTSMNRMKYNNKCGIVTEKRQNEAGETVFYVQVDPIGRQIAVGIQNITEFPANYP